MLLGDSQWGKELETLLQGLEKKTEKRDKQQEPKEKLREKETKLEKPREGETWQICSASASLGENMVSFAGVPQWSTEAA